MAPFIILGVGLDDTFIITGAYFRRLKEEIQEHEKKHKQRKSVSKRALLEDDEVSDDLSIADSTTNPLEQLYDHSVIVERVRSTLQEVGMSISLTTLTTTTAFVLGCLSTIPGIRWLCLCESLKTWHFGWLY